MLPFIGVEWTGHDGLMFAWRLIILGIVCVLLSVATVMTENNITLEKYRYRYNKKLLKIRWVIICLLIFLSVAIGAFSIWELCNNNPNEWLGMKISFYIFVWSLVINLSVYLEDCSDKKLEKKLKGACTTSAVMSFLGIFATIAFFFYGIECQCSFKETSFRQEVISDVELVATNDGRQINGGFASGLFTATLTISENGVYRYYYKDQNGGIKQGHVDADKTTIYYTGGETPHLRCLVSYKYLSGYIINNRPYKVKVDEKTYYELYVPEGSILESYAFDLN